MINRPMDFIEKILGPAKDEEYNYPVLPKIEYWLWDYGVFYRKGKGPRKCLIGCKDTSVWIWVGSPPIEDHRINLEDPGSIQKIKQIMRVK